MDLIKEEVYEIQIQAWSTEQIPYSNPISTESNLASETNPIEVNQNTAAVENVVIGETTVSIELSKEDEDDAKSIADMFGTDGAKCEPCCLNECNSKIPKDLAVQHRYSFQELDKKEKELVILSHLQQHRRVDPLITEYAKCNRSRLKLKDSLSRQLISYYFCDIKICKKMYFFIHDIGSKEFKNLVKHYDEKGLTPRVHKLKNVPSSRDLALSADDTANIVLFIRQFGEEFGRPVVRRTAKMRPPQFKNYTTIGLADNISKCFVHKKYCESGMRKIGRKTFYKIWNQYCPYIITLHRPASGTKRNSEENYG